ncbi:SGNH/GDSL hydrolase family protein [Massilia glaciei]|uniref:Esterase n=1 Tax=Massilia glaciei TaxID=1524097 RepID=A0A2U2I4N1_9BURK|nr:SGNH/GDSL hydrolase family protein [Massilia glaciei]PWF54677.1 esterase [Massilia glaciei]
MRQTNFALAVMAAAVLAACGGSDNNNTAPVPAKPVFASQVSFGDSLSDVGSYRVGTIALLNGGKYTINGNNTAVNATLTGKNWTEVTAAAFNLSAPCAAVTGLDGAAAQGFSVPLVNNLSCTGYAQGGSRVSNPVGPGHKLTGSPLGQLTIPVSTQIATHLSRNNGAFKGNEVVFVMAGGNDAFMLLGGLTAAATAAGNTAGAAEGAKVGAATFASTLVPLLAAGATNPTTAAQAIGAAMATEAARAGSTSTSLVGVAVQTAATQPGNAAVGQPTVYGPMVVQAQTAATTAGNAAGLVAGTNAANAYAAANGPALVAVMADTGLALANLVKTQILAKGANHVVVLNLPDIASAPTGKAQSASAQTLIAGMISGYNTALKAGLDGTDAKVLQVDAYSASNDQVKNPAKYGFSNTTTPACGPNALGTTSLVCTGANVLAGVDVSRYMFADDTHPTPYSHSLVAKLVLDSMVAKGWR